MFCTNCGAQIADDSQFCTQCGTSFQQQSAVEDIFQVAPASTTVAVPAVPSTYAYQAAQPVQQKSPKGRGVLIALVVLVLLALIGAIILVVVNPFDAGNSKALTTDQMSSSTTSTTDQTPSNTTSTTDKTSSNTTSTEQNSSKSESSDKADNKEAPKDTLTAEQPPLTSETTSTSTSPFYGVWIGAFLEKDKAESFCAEARSKGFNAKIFESNQWTNLNQDHYWVITAETAQTREAADRQLTAVKSAGYSNAYVKYSGTYKG